jgi:hypothetical protein
MKSRKMEWAEHVARMGERNTYRVLVVSSEEKGPLGRSRRGSEDDIKMHWENSLVENVLH